LDLYAFQQHFEKDQYESSRADNKQKLRQNAVPNVFPTSNVSDGTASAAHVHRCPQPSDHNYDINNNCHKNGKKRLMDGDLNATPLKLRNTSETALENVFDG
jgi:hypothetical protein